MPAHCGHVYVMHWNVAAKQKLFVPAYSMTDGRVRGFLINTDVPLFFQTKPELMAHVLPIQHSLNSRFLDYDSWLCCNEVVGGFTVTQLENATGSYRGPIDSTLQVEVLRVVQTSRLIPERDKVQILANWPPTPPAVPASAPSIAPEPI